MVNILTEISKLPKKEQKGYFTMNPKIIEKYEIEKIGGKHNPEINGSDGWLITGESVEVKSQIYSGNYTLRGRIKYSAPSSSIYHNKMDKDEFTIIVGVTEEGIIMYRFSINFSAVSDRYWDVMPTTNADILPSTYQSHSSFKVHYIADKDILMNYSHVFTNKFYWNLMDLHDNGDIVPLV